MTAGAFPRGIDLHQDVRGGSFSDWDMGESRRSLTEGKHAPNSPLLLPWIWPLISAASISRAAAAGFGTLARSLAARSLAAGNQANAESSPAFDWTTGHRLALELPSMRLRDFSLSESGPATVVCAPFALHGATVADFAPGHSLVERLRREGVQRLVVTDWRSATPAMKNFSIDTYLADLNVAVDDGRPPVNLIGLCQGGWLALAYAARFPWKVRKLVLAGSPIDVAAGSSPLSDLAAATPFSTFQELVELGEGRMLGGHLLEMWGARLAGQADACLMLQVPAERTPDELRRHFQRWCLSAVDLPGTYYLQVAQQIFKENQIARGRFVALGRRIDLADIRVPLALLAARDDEIVDERQVFAAARLVGTAAADVIKLKEPCRHLSLFMGAKTLDRAWPRIARWLNHDNALALAS